MKPRAYKLTLISAKTFDSFSMWAYRLFQMKYLSHFWTHLTPIAKSPVSFALKIN